MLFQERYRASRQSEHPVCTHTHIYIYVYAHTIQYIYVYVGMYVCMSVCMSVCMYMRTYIIHTHTYILTHTPQDESRVAKGGLRPASPGDACRLGHPEDLHSFLTHTYIHTYIHTLLYCRSAMLLYKPTPTHKNV